MLSDPVSLSQMLSMSVSFRACAPFCGWEGARARAEGRTSGRQGKSHRGKPEAKILPLWLLLVLLYLITVASLLISSSRLPSA